MAVTQGAPKSRSRRNNKALSEAKRERSCGQPRTLPRDLLPADGPAAADDALSITSGQPGERGARRVSPQLGHLVWFSVCTCSNIFSCSRGSSPETRISEVSNRESAGSKCLKWTQSHSSITERKEGHRHAMSMYLSGHIYPRG